MNSEEKPTLEEAKAKGMLPAVTLVGQDGNAFFIIGTVKKALVRACLAHLAADFQKEATSGDYDGVLRAANEVFGGRVTIMKSKIPRLDLCHDCGAKPGECHGDNCDVERCSVCAGQRLMCDCKGHDKKFARWVGLWPGYAEAKELGVDLNEFSIRYAKMFFTKPRK